LADVLAAGGRCFVPVVRLGATCAPNTLTCRDKLVVASDGCLVAAADAHRVTVLATKDHYWIGLSGIYEWMMTAPTEDKKPDLGKLEEILKNVKYGEFLERADIEITADSDVPYHDVLDILAISVVAGWEMPQLVSLKRASYLPSPP
jgi:hypothetical protein